MPGAACIYTDYQCGHDDIPPHAEYVYGGMYRQVSDLSVRAYIRIINTGGYVHEWE